MGVAVSVAVAVWVGVSVKVDIEDGVGELVRGIATAGIWQARMVNVMMNGMSFDFMVVYLIQTSWQWQ